MADIKISELPLLPSFDINDVLIVNDTSANTTCKTPVSAIKSYVDFNLTCNIMTSGTVTATLSKLFTFGYYMSINFNNCKFVGDSSTPIVFTSDSPEWVYRRVLASQFVGITIENAGGFNPYSIFPTIQGATNPGLFIQALNKNTNINGWSVGNIYPIENTTCSINGGLSLLVA